MKKITILLPAFQVIVAACLMWSNYRGPDTVSNPAWYQANWQVCVGINAPAFVFANIITNVIYRLTADRLIDTSLFLILDAVARLSLIWLTWYAVSIEIGGRGQSVLTRKTRSRRPTDGLAILFGFILFVTGSASVRRLGDGYARIIFIPYILWTLAIIGFYGWDLWVSRPIQRRPSP